MLGFFVAAHLSLSEINKVLMLCIVWSASYVWEYRRLAARNSRHKKGSRGSHKETTPQEVAVKLVRHYLKYPFQAIAIRANYGVYCHIVNQNRLSIELKAFNDEIVA